MATMSPTRTHAMEKIGQGIAFDNDRQKLLLVGGRIGNATTQRTVRARKVTARIERGFLCSAKDQVGRPLPVSRFEEIEFEQRGEKVLAQVRA